MKTHINKPILLTYFQEPKNSFSEYFVEYVDFLKKQGKTVYVITDNQDLIKPILWHKAEILFIENEGNTILTFLKNFFKIKNFLKEKHIKNIHIFDNIFYKYLKYMKLNGVKIFVNFNGDNFCKNKKITIEKYICFTKSLADILGTMTEKNKILQLKTPLNSQKFNLKSVSDERFKKLMKEWNVDEKTFTFLVVFEEFNSFYSNLEDAVFNLKKIGYEFKIFGLVKSEEFVNIAKEKSRILELKIHDCFGFVYNVRDTDCIFKIINCYVESKEKPEFSNYAEIAHLMQRPVLIDYKNDGIELIDQDKTGKFFNPEDKTSILSSMKWILDRNKKQTAEMADDILKSQKPVDRIDTFEKMSLYK